MMNNMDPQRDVDPYNLCRRRRSLSFKLSEWWVKHGLEYLVMLIVLVLFGLLLWWSSGVGAERMAGQ